MKHIRKRSVCLLLTLALCVPLLAALGTSASAETLEERQQAAVAVAMAYFDKGHSVQYDGSQMVYHIKRSDGGYTRQTNQVSPEYATPDETMYTVCSDFPHQVYWEAFRYHVNGYNAGTNTTAALLRVPKDDPMTVWYWEKESGIDAEDAIGEMLKLAQPGDIFTALHKGGGHTMLCVGDVLGDGTIYFAHSWGGRYDRTPVLRDTREYGKDDSIVDSRVRASKNTDSNGGSIRLTVSKPWIAKQYGNEARTKMNLLRPANVLKDDTNPIRPATRYRMTHPRLAIDRTMSKTRFTSAFTGETVTMTLKLSNSSKETYTVPVTEKVPAGAKLKTPFEGAAVTGDTMTWNVELPAGEAKTFTCEYEITAKRGEKVVFEGGSVGDIPSNSIPIQVGGKKLTAEDNAKLAAIANGDYNDKLAAAGANDNNLGNVVYQDILGLNVRFPENSWVIRNLLHRTKTRSGVEMRQFKTADEVQKEDLATYQMLVPTAWGGFEIWYEWGNERMNDPRDKHLEPGDVVVRSHSILPASQILELVYLGDGKYLGFDSAKTKTCQIVDEPEFFKCITEEIFYVMRPTLAYDDVHALPALTEDATALKFEDVKGSDWFYTYVKDLVADGTVNGMTDKTFEPNGTLTYGQALKLIALGIGEKEPAKTGDHWASGYLALAKEKKWLTKDVDLDATITRLELCKIAAKAKNVTSQPKTNPFADTEDKDVLALNKAGVINGMKEKTFEPQGLLTRAQIAKIICALRAVENTQAEKPEPQASSD